MESAAQQKVCFQWQINLGMVLFALVFLPITVSLGFWQLSRADEKREILSENHRREMSLPVSVLSLNLQQEHQYRRAMASGRFINNKTLLLADRIRQGKPGYEVLTPLLMSEGEPWLWVNRGWIAGSFNRSELPAVPAIEGAVHVRGQLYRPLDKPFKVGEDQWRQQWPQVLQNFEMDLVAVQMKRDFFPYQLRLDQDSKGALKTGWTLVNVMPEKHTGYAVQWFAMAFALIVLSVFANSNLGTLLKSRKTANS